MSVPLCPNTKCKVRNRVCRAGFSRGLKCLQNKPRQRYICFGCGFKFSENYYDLSYRLKKADPGLNAKIFLFCVYGISNRDIAALNYISANCVRIRLQRLSQQALVFQNEMMASFKITESVCMDGLENFAGSQYDPNNVNQAVGRDSLYIYDFNLANLNRKGYKSPWQKVRLAQIEQLLGRYNPSAIRIAARELFLRLHTKVESGKELNLLTDMHPQYKRALADIPKKFRFNHVTISSKACRNFQNILFSVNHVDLVIRAKIKAFARETYSFSKTPGAMCQKYALYMVFKNFMRPQFTKKHVRRPRAHTDSPAQHLNLCEKLLGFSDVFHRRSLPEDKNDLNSEWSYFWSGKVPPQFERSKKFCRILSGTIQPA